MATEIVRAGGSGLRSAAAAGGWRGRLDILGWGIGTIDLNYLQQLKAADPKILREVDTIAFHVYASVDPLRCPTIDSAGSTVERTQASHCIRSLMDVREWLDDNGGAQVGLAITEGGFSGSDDDCVPPNVVDEKKQALFNHRTVDWLRTHPELEVRGLPALPRARQRVGAVSRQQRILVRRQQLRPGLLAGQSGDGAAGHVAEAGRRVVPGADPGGAQAGCRAGRQALSGPALGIARADFGVEGG